MDIQAARIDLVGRHLSFTAPLLIDARKKPSYPDELFCDARTAEIVDRKWNEYSKASSRWARATAPRRDYRLTAEITPYSPHIVTSAFPKTWCTRSACSLTAFATSQSFPPDPS